MVELAEIFRRHGPLYRTKFGDRMLPSHRQVMRAIEQCRTEALGGHVYSCLDCEQVQYSYHSCRNRHYPKCQHERTQQWLEKQQDLRLPVPYFMLTFTLPEALRNVARSHQKLIYNLLFRTSAEAAQQLARDPRFVGGRLGMLGVLHTWGRNLSYHPHVHYLVPAGGLKADGQTLRAEAQPEARLTTRKNFLFPVKALSKLFRAKFRDALRKHDCFDNVPAAVWRQDWVVHCQPVGNGEGALKYLALYIFRVAISNQRILKLADGKVTFCFKDTGSGKTKLCTLAAEEFMRRFLQHVLPKGFVKVRYYGPFSPGWRQQLASLRHLFSGLQAEGSAAPDEMDADREDRSQSPVRCPNCGKAMQRRQIILPKERYPP